MSARPRKSTARQKCAVGQETAARSAGRIDPPPGGPPAAIPAGLIPVAVDRLTGGSRRTRDGVCPARRGGADRWGAGQGPPVQVNASPKSSRLAQKRRPGQERALATSGSEPSGGGEGLIEPAASQERPESR